MRQIFISVFIILNSSLLALPLFEEEVVEEAETLIPREQTQNTSMNPSFPPSPGEHLATSSPNANSASQSASSTTSFISATLEGKTIEQLPPHSAPLQTEDLQAINGENLISTSSSSIRQVASPQVRAEEAVSELKDTTTLAKELVLGLEKLQSIKENRDTMLFLEMLNVNSTTRFSHNFWAAHQGQNLSHSNFILNNAASPLQFVVSGVGEIKSVITPKIILSEAKGQDPATGTYLPLEVNTTIQTAEDRKQVRRYFQQTLQTFYGHIEDERLQATIQSYTALQNIEQPIYLMNLFDFFNEIPDVEIEKAFEVALENQQTKLQVFEKKDLERLLENYKKLPPISNDIRFNTEKASQLLMKPEEYLAAATYHALDATARAAGVAGGATVGAVLGSTIGGTIALCDAYRRPPNQITTTDRVVFSIIASTASIGGTCGLIYGIHLFNALAHHRMAVLTYNHGSRVVGDGAITSNAALVAVPLLFIMGVMGGPCYLGMPLITALAAIPSALRFGREFGTEANTYYNPGSSLQKAKEALSTLSQDVEKASEALQALDTMQTSIEETKSSFQDFFSTLRQEQSSVTTSSSSSDPDPNLEVARKIEIVNASEAAFVEEANKQLTEIEELRSGLQTAMQQRSQQREEHAKWKGTFDNGGNIGPYYRRPGF